jgi:MFS family permease
VSSGGTLGALRSVWSNEAVRRAQLALAGSTIGDWSYSVAFSVLVYDRAGAAWVGIAQVCRLVPAAIAAPLLASVIDRYPRQRVLFATDAVRATIMTALFLSAALGGPLPLLIGLAMLNAIVATLFWPSQAAMLPTLVREPEELTAANVASTTVESTGCVIGPALGATVLALFGTTTAFVVPIVAYALSAVAVLRVHPVVVEGVAPDGGDEAQGDPEESGGHGMLAGLSAILGNGDVRVLISLYSAQVLIAGALNVLTVVAALQLLHAGDGGVGELVAALGIGGLIGAVPALTLSRRAPLTSVFVWGLVLWGAPLVVIGIFPHLVVAIAMLALVGVGNTLVDVSGITLLQRATPAALLGRVFGVLESLVIASVALGAAIVPVLLRLVGDRTTFVLTGVLLPLIALPLWGRLRRLDVPTVSPRRLELLRTNPIFAGLSEAIVEQLAALLEPVSLAPGEVLFRQGDVGDRYYLIDAGAVLIQRAGKETVMLGAGDGFGEIALIRGVPRTATIEAGSAVRLLGLRGDEFVSAVTGHATSAAAADAVIASRLHTLRPALASV